ncbi:hypothetical protein ACFLUK_01550 [Chloroflexota bacterium]
MPSLGFLGKVPRRETGNNMMGVTEYLVLLLGSAPALVFWIAVVVFAAVMVRRGGGQAERFLIAGAGLKIISNLLILPSFAIRNWLMQEGYSMDSANSVVSGYGIFCNIIGMAGIICLVYAFWVKFKARNFEGAKPLSNTSSPSPSQGERD